MHRGPQEIHRLRMSIGWDLSACVTTRKDEKKFVVLLMQLLTILVINNIRLMCHFCASH